jgi:hypothetical protein
MIAIAALALGLTVGPGPDFSEAYERAKRYGDDKAASEFLSKGFHPAVDDKMDRVIADCRRRARPVKDTFFIVVISYKGGKADHVFLDRDAPYSRCIAERLSALAYPDSPVADFAEDFEITMDY